ncbi:hypothetical protein [Erysipelothrix anatis]|uniref:hypothetical protein n=1 Tax=Erysipelothrix anatis TaxID=2683713 RepID=UPI00135B79CF|nr:hypothetical protein [Erysipelothrix anatis]
MKNNVSIKTLLAGNGFILLGVFLGQIDSGFASWASLLMAGLGFIFILIGLVVGD